MPKFNNANFPLDDERRTYHVGTKTGEVAARIITVGDHSRAALIAGYLDKDSSVTRILSKRGFLTITGRFKGVEVSICAIGMGTPMMDFFVRETRAVVEGPMVIVRFGSCGSISTTGHIGSIAVCTGSLMISRQWDYFTGSSKGVGEPYRLSDVVQADKGLTTAVKTNLEAHIGVDHVVTGINATADSFYSSQGRLDPMFDDANLTLVDTVLEAHPSAQTLEMEAFPLLHLAQCASDVAIAGQTRNTIAAAAAMMIFADRSSGDFIDPEMVAKLERVGGLAILESITSFKLE